MEFTSKMKKLHTVYYVCDGGIHAQDVGVVMEKRPPSLRRLSVNGIMWEVGNFIVCSAQLPYGSLVIGRDHGYRTQIQHQMLSGLCVSFPISKTSVG